MTLNLLLCTVWTTNFAINIALKASGIETKEISESVRDNTFLSFYSLQASEPSINFYISKLVFDFT